VFQTFTYIAPHSPPALLQGTVVLKDEFLEAEVSLEREVVHKVGGWKYVSIMHEGFAGHQLHKPLAEVSHEPLLQ